MREERKEKKKEEEGGRRSSNSKIIKFRMADAKRRSPLQKSTPSNQLNQRNSPSGTLPQIECFPTVAARF